MQNLDEVRGEIKAIVEACQGTPTAKLIAVLAAAGITKSAEVAALIGISERAVRKAKAELQDRGNYSSGGTTVPEKAELQFRAELQDRSYSSGGGTTVPDSALARVVDNSSLTSLEDRSQNLVKPPIVPPKPKTTSKRGSRLADDWALPDDWRDWARVTCPAASPDMIDREALKFGNYWQSKAGRDAIKIDWKKTWQNWCLTAFATAPTRPQSNAPNWVDERREKNRKFLEMVRNLPASGVAQ